MLKELFEGHFYGTFPKVQNRVLNLTEYVQNGTFSLLDPKLAETVTIFVTATLQIGSK